MLLKPDDRIFVAGHRGMAGCCCRAFQGGIPQCVVASRTELDLEDRSAVQSWFAQHKPTVVVLAAAKSEEFRQITITQLILVKTKIQNNVIELSWSLGVRRLFLGSSCIYPNFLSSPLRRKRCFPGCSNTNQCMPLQITGLMCEALRQLLMPSLMPTNCLGRR